jgi:lipoprotein-anchoring transpeptidase ErfK/SrfK
MSRHTLACGPPLAPICGFLKVMRGAAHRWVRERDVRFVIAALVAVVALGAGVVVVGLDAGHAAARPQPAALPVARPAPPVVAPTTTTTVPPPPIPAVTLLAALKGTIPTFGAPGGAQTGTVGPWYGYPLTLPVIVEQGSWLDVRLPLRPNGSTAWVRESDVNLSFTPYRIVVHLIRQELIVYRGGVRVMAFPTGLGLPATPTPTGNYFVAVRETNPPPAYGPIILDTSAHSEAIQSWEGAGDAVIAVHGPITSYADAEIGAAGARVSNGCIRLHDWDLAKLEVIPVGTPLDITD